MHANMPGTPKQSVGVIGRPREMSLPTQKRWSSTKDAHRFIVKIEMNEADAAEGGCGVVGLASEIPIAGRHLFNSLEQMRNRTEKVAEWPWPDLTQYNSIRHKMSSRCYLVAIAWVNDGYREEVESKFINPVFDVFIPSTCLFLRIGKTWLHWKFAPCSDRIGSIQQNRNRFNV